MTRSAMPPAFAATRRWFRCGERARRRWPSELCSRNWRLTLSGGTKLLRVQENRCARVLTDGGLRDFDELARYDFAAYCSGEATPWGATLRAHANGNR